MESDTLWLLLIALTILCAILWLILPELRSRLFSRSQRKVQPDGFGSAKKLNADGQFVDVTDPNEPLWEEANPIVRERIKASRRLDQLVYGSNKTGVDKRTTLLKAGAVVVVLLTVFPPSRPIYFNKWNSSRASGPS